jgi:hypothetical protein
LIVSSRSLIVSETSASRWKCLAGLLIFIKAWSAWRLRAIYLAPVCRFRRRVRSCRPVAQNATAGQAFDITTLTGVADGGFVVLRTPTVVAAAAAPKACIRRKRGYLVGIMTKLVKNRRFLSHAGCLQPGR